MEERQKHLQMLWNEYQQLFRAFERLAYWLKRPEEEWRDIQVRLLAKQQEYLALRDAPEEVPAPTPSLIKEHQLPMGGRYVVLEIGGVFLAGEYNHDDQGVFQFRYDGSEGAVGAFATYDEAKAHCEWMWSNPGWLGHTPPSWVR
jgi:hypothetical protein